MLQAYFPSLVQVLGPETTAYLVAALNPPGVCARGLSRVLLKAVQRPAPIPLFVAQRAEEVIKGAFLAAWRSLSEAHPCIMRARLSMADHLLLQESLSSGPEPCCLP